MIGHGSKKGMTCAKLESMREDERNNAYRKFIFNISGGDEQWFQLNNHIVQRCVDNGFVSGMTEIETLRTVIFALVKLSDEDLQRKMNEMMMRPIDIRKL